MEFSREERIRWSAVTSASIRTAASQRVPILDVLCASVLILMQYSQHKDLAEYLINFYQMSETIAGLDSEVNEIFDDVWEATKESYEEAKGEKGPVLPSGLTLPQHLENAQKLCDEFSIDLPTMQATSIAGIMIGSAKAVGMELHTVGYLISQTFEAIFRSGDCDRKHLVEYVADIYGNSTLTFVARASGEIAIASAPILIATIEEKLREEKETWPQDN